MVKGFWGGDAPCRQVTIVYILCLLIQSFRHKGLQRLFEKADARRLSHSDVPKIERILARLDEASEVDHMGLPGFRLHPLKGDRKGFGP